MSFTKFEINFATKTDIVDLGGGWDRKKLVRFPCVRSRSSKSETVSKFFFETVSDSRATLRLALLLTGNACEFMHERTQPVWHGDITGAEGVDSVVSFDTDQVVDHISSGV